MLDFQKLQHACFKIQVGFQIACLVCQDAWGCVQVSSSYAEKIECFREVQWKLGENSIGSEVHCTVQYWAVKCTVLWITEQWRAMYCSVLNSEVHFTVQYWAMKCIVLCSTNKRSAVYSAVPNSEVLSYELHCTEQYWAFKCTIICSTKQWSALYCALCSTKQWSALYCAVLNRDLLSAVLYIELYGWSLLLEVA